MRKKLPHNNVCVRLQKSRISGIGVFAIVDIPKGKYVFEGDKSEICWFTEEELALPSLPQVIQDLYNDFCVIKTEGTQKLYGCPDSFNNMPISWYLNDSDNPNMACNKDYDFYSIRDIKAEEELTAKYDTYSEEVHIL
jgi:uncharacterized protein